ncbi:hypothetical protein CEP54_013215 [Fusarium duplospermum]|uniref:NACHT domain-containing protein n=1 Tax=Fusarium duplospermum TaxID=1325734 RepID=A0A428P445_9HYPO|nr:hypothetical protein CEP54_013215 [Fusarium duplospermum]
MSNSNVIDCTGSSSQDSLEGRSKILRWLCPQEIFSALTTPAEGQSNHDSHKDAGKSFTNSPKFQEWLAGKEKRIWGSGPPGAGKTFLVSRVQNDLKHRDMFQGSASKARAAVLYLHHSERYSLKDLLGCMFRQFVEATSQIHPNVENLWINKAGNTGPDAKELTELIQDLTKDDINLYVIVDAWDECKLQTRGQFLRELLSFGEHISIFITSRFTSSHENCQSDFFHENISAKENDIRGYVSHCIANSSRLKHFTQLDRGLELEIKNRLVEESGSNKEGRIFLLVRLHMDSLQNEVRLDGVRKKLKMLRHDLNDKYRDIIERIDDQEPACQEIAIDALIWITHARRPLTAKELQHALAVSLEDPRFNPAREPRVDDIVAFSCSMVILEASSNTFRLVHNTAKKFMEDLSETDSRFKDPHSKISLVSSTYLCIPQLEQRDDLLQRVSPATDLWADPPQYNEQDAYDMQCQCYADSWPLGGKEQLREFSFQTKSYLFPLASYAAIHLGHHLRGMQDSESNFAQDALKHTHTILSERPKRNFYVRLLSDAGCYPPHTFAHYYGHWNPGGMTHEFGDSGSEFFDDPESGLSDQTEGSSQEEHQKEITCLHLAAQIGVPRLLTGLIGDGSLLQVRDYEGFNPLGIALCSGHSSIVLSLLKAGSTLDLRSGEGCRLLLFAAQSRSSCAGQVVDHILQHHLRMPDNGRHPIVQYFTWFGVVALTKVLFYGWGLSKLWSGLTSFLMRVRTYWTSRPEPRATRPLGPSSTNVVTFSQATTESPVAEPISPPRPLARTYSEAVLPFDRLQERDYLKLVVAALQGDSAKINSLVADGKVILKCQHDRFHSNTPALIVNLALFLAIERGKTEVVEKVIKGGVPVESRDYDGRTPLHRAVLKRNAALVKFLIEYEAEIDVEDFKKETPWVLAAREGYYEICRLLVEYGANVNTQGIDGVSLLYQAAAAGDAGKVRYLLQQGVDPSITTDYGWSPLHWAAANGHMNCVKLLLDAKADVNPISDTYKSPLDLAIEHDRKGIVDVLQAHGAKTSNRLFALSWESERGD